MSHFSVFVTGDDVEKQLAPFQENNMGTCPSEYLTFHDMHDDCLQQWEEGDRDGIPFKKRFATFEAFVDSEFSYEQNHDTGRYGYTENPNAKWDWYQIGGRWSGELMLLRDAEADYDPVRRSDTGRAFVDSALRGDIDFPAMEAALHAGALAGWHRTLETTLGIMSLEALHAIRRWDEVRADMTARGASIDDARSVYWGQTGVPELRDALLKADLWSWDLSPEDIAAMLSRVPEGYAAERARQGWLPFALLDDGEWVERGTMAMFGIAIDEKDGETWVATIRERILGLPADMPITIVECHI
ncbi:MAG: hypothetical protein ABF665_03145 [Gluconacetobacter sp.]